MTSLICPRWSDAVSDAVMQGEISHFCLRWDGEGQSGGAVGVGNDEGAKMGLDGHDKSSRYIGLALVVAMYRG